MRLGDDDVKWQRMAVTGRKQIESEKNRYGIIFVKKNWTNCSELLLVIVSLFLEFEEHGKTNTRQPHNDSTLFNFGFSSYCVHFEKIKSVCHAFQRIAFANLHYSYFDAHNSCSN